MDYHLTWYKCCPHWDDVQWPWLGSIPQRSWSHNTFKVQSTNARVCAITYVCIDGLSSNLVQMLSSLRRCVVTLTRIHTSKALTSGSVQFWSGWEKNKMFLKKQWRDNSHPLDCLVLFDKKRCAHKICLVVCYWQPFCMYSDIYISCMKNRIH